MSAMASGEDAATTKRPLAEGTLDQGESKKAAVGDTACPDDAGKHPPSRRGIIVNLMVENADKFVDFMGKTTAAKEYFRFAGDNGKVMHLALDIDGVAIYVEELGNNMDKGTVATPHVRLHVNTDDPMPLAEKLLKAGAKEVNKCEEQFWGSKFGVFLDPFGQTWSVSNTSTPLHDVPAELSRKVIPFVSVRNAEGYIAFLTEVFGAEIVYPPAKDPTGAIMCAELKVNGGLIMIGDHCAEHAGKQDASVTVAYEVSTGKAAPLAKTFEAHGGEIVEQPAMMFWGQVWGRAKDAFGQAWGLCEVQTGAPPSHEDMAVDMKIGAKHDWKYTWVMENMPITHCYGEVRTCLAKGPAISKEMSEMLPLSFAGAAKAGMPPAGPPMSAYFTWDSAENGQTTFTSGPTVAGGGAAAAEGNALGVRTVGGCECVTVVHTGPYDKLMETYTATFEWIAAKGYESGMPVMEIYENDAKKVEASKLKTKICIPIVKKGATPKKA